MIPESRVRKCARANRRAGTNYRAYAVPASKCEASNIETLLTASTATGRNVFAGFPAVALIVNNHRLFLPRCVRFLNEGATA